MFRRWLIRGFLLFLLLLLAAGWGVSTGRHVSCGYGHDKNWVVCGLDYGELFLVWRRGYQCPDGWNSQFGPHPFRVVCVGFLWHFTSTSDSVATRLSSSLVGFGYDGHRCWIVPGLHLEAHSVSIPFWFLLVVTGAGLCYAWKKTGPRRVARGFPVQATNGEGPWNRDR